MENYIFLDIDGTILEFQHNEINEDTVRDIRQAQANGHHVWINTGRSYSEISDYIKTFGFDGIISSCGSVIMQGNEFIYYDPMDGNDINEICTLLVNDNRPFILEGQYESLTPKQYEGSALEIYELVKDMFNNKVSDFPLSNQQAKDFIKLTIFDGGRVLESLKKYDQYTLSIEEYKGTINIELYKKHNNKAMGIKRLIDYVGGGYTIGIGDSANDIDMLNACDVSFCMENGSQKAKEAAKYITTSVSNNGVGEALRKLNLI